jgi:hypothetical protein
MTMAECVVRKSIPYADTCACAEPMARPAALSGERRQQLSATLFHALAR